VLLASDVIYEPGGLERLVDAADRVDLVLIGDPERRPLAHGRLERLAWCEARTVPDVDEQTRGVTLFRVLRPVRAADPQALAGTRTSS